MNKRNTILLAVLCAFPFVLAALLLIPPVKTALFDFGVELLLIFWKPLLAALIILLLAQKAIYGPDGRRRS